MSPLRTGASLEESVSAFKGAESVFAAKQETDFSRLRGLRGNAWTEEQAMKRIVFGISGASGMPLAKAVLQAFCTLPDLEIHGIVSEHAEAVLLAECGETAAFFSDVLHTLYNPADMTAGPASGSWLHDGMIVCPCSMSTLGTIVSGGGQSLLHRAADVTLKEKRPLLLVVRETPLSRIHLRNMLLAEECGATIMPFMPAFYAGENSLEAMMRQFAGRLLDQLKLSHTFASRWKENL